MKLTRIIASGLLALLWSLSPLFAQPWNFNPDQDFLLANFDLMPDEDDVMAAAALSCMLQHPDLAGVKYFAVAGAYGTQQCRDYIHTAIVITSYSIHYTKLYELTG